MIRKAAIVLSFVAIVLVMVGIFFVLIHLEGPRIVAHAASADGVEMVIIQSCNWSFEPFTTSFRYQKPGKPWGYFYYDHEDSYWRHGTVSLDESKTTAVFFRRGKPAVTFDWAAERYTLHRIGRTLTGAQNYAPKGAPRPF